MLTYELERGRQALGDWFCLEGDCKYGELLVTQMLAVYATAVHKLSDADLRPFLDKFQPTVDATRAAHDDLQAKWISRMFLMAQVCCNMKEVGKQAEDLQRQMLAYLGAYTPIRIKPPTAPQLIPDWLASTLKWTLILGAVGVGTWGTVTLVKTFRHA